MVMNIDTLAEKIYQEGVEKAESESQQIVDKAKEEAQKIIKEAEEQSEKIIDQAQKKAEEIRQNTLSDIKLGGGKAISSLKQEIKNMVALKVIDDPVKELFRDQKFLEKLVLETIENYKNEVDQVILPEALKDETGKRFKQSLGKEIKDIKIDFNKKLSGGFQLSVKNSDYLITFTDEDFIAFFRQFLNEKSEQILFEKP